MSKISVIGAGAVGATTAFSLALESYVNEVVIVDINKDRAEGNALDVMHAVSLSSPVNVTYGDYEDTANSDLVVITVGVPEKVGESRLIPLQKNVNILKEIVPQITKNSPDCCLLMVTNPVDILAQVAYKISGFPKERVIGLGTSLDTARLQYLLGRDLDIAPESVDALVVGEHGDSQVVAWSKTKIGGVDIDTFAELIGKELPANYKASIEDEVKQTAFDVWEKKGPNCYCVAMAINKVAKAIIRDEVIVLPVSNLYECEEVNDIYLSLPSIVSKKGVQKQLNIPLENEEKEKLLESARLLADLYEQIEI